MNIIKTILDGCFILEPEIFPDSRGYFFESFNKKKLKQILDTEIEFVQDNQSKSSKGVLRGLHYQTGSHCQAKLVRVIQGTVLDVAVDIRPNSATYGQYIKVVLSEENKKQIFIPKGFAHGFLVLSESAIFTYKCDNYYNKEAEAGIRFNDPDLNIDWELLSCDLIISEKDLELPMFKEAKPIW